MAGTKGVNNFAAVTNVTKQDMYIKRNQLHKFKGLLCNLYEIKLTPPNEFPHTTSRKLIFFEPSSALADTIPLYITSYTISIPVNSQKNSKANTRELQISQPLKQVSQERTIQAMKN